MKILSIAWKDMQIFLKDRGGMFYLILLPLVFIIVFSGAMSAIGQGGKDTRIQLDVIDLDDGQAAQTLLKGLDAAGGVRVELREEAKALNLLDDNKISRVLIIPSGFSVDYSENRLVTLKLINHPDANTEQTRAVQLVIEGVAQNMALESQILASLKQMGDMQANAPAAFQQAFSVERTQAQARSQFEGGQTQPLVEVKQTIPSKKEESQEVPKLEDVAVPGFAVLFIFLTAQSTALSIFEEKKVGSFRRLVAAPMSKVSLLVGKITLNFITALIQAVIILTFGAFGLRLFGLTPVSLGNDPLALVLVLIALCSSTLGLVIAALTHTEAQIAGLGSLLLWGLGIVGGSIIPVFILDRFGFLPKIIPHYWANRALDNIMLRGLGLANITTELAVLSGFTVLFFVIGLWRFDFD